MYKDAASGKKDDRPGLAACLKALREVTRSSSGRSIALVAIYVT
ncbi:hypothetical protein Agau_L101223 [Agrobacterium tumefaciens F2]|nr:hypothetical protein Agau_L101223 [Agrobacterium tumefaciens F2]